MNEIFENARKICITLLSTERRAITPDIINAAVENVCKIFPQLSPGDRSLLFQQLEAQYAVFSDQYKILDDTEPVEWVKDAKADIQWKFWNRYRISLELKGYAPDTVNKLDNLTDEILDRLVRPGSHNRFDKRGLIVGHVQSGKTSNYTGLICKAADAGYRLIIVLAGIHNSLRSQTQLRIDEGFLGFDTKTARNFAQASNRIGVGRIDPNLAAHSLTTSDANGDFSRRASEASGINIRGNDPIILVIKKNYSILKNLLMWLAGRGETMSDGLKLIRNLPLLLIDDEADNASINISPSGVSKINAGIRALLKLFEQTAYIGYTATPYANIFIKNDDEEDDKGLSLNFDVINFSLGRDIFPKDFIVNIPAPSNYVGPARIFGIVSTEEIDKEVEPISLYKIVDDYQPQVPPKNDIEANIKYNAEIGGIREDNSRYILDTHKNGDSLPKELPVSLKDAIKYFFLSCAARRARGQEKQHNSMLIHVSRFIRWQQRIADLVTDTFKFYSRQLEFNHAPFLEELKAIWEGNYVDKTRELITNKSVNDPGITEISWDDLVPHIYPAISKIDIRAVHGDSRIPGLHYNNIRPLDYFEKENTGLSVIAIGGNKLSRGLTLEGLTISYYLRASKMYDTLMQMGRWFGYRSGYLDLCRLFTSSELVEWYRHITVATEEMRAEFDRMADLGKKPSEYGLKVRTHPGALSITASNKFRYKKIMELSYSGELEETYSFIKHSPELRNNLDNTIAFLSRLGEPDGPPNSVRAFRNHYVWRAKNNSAQVVDFLNSYKSFLPAAFNVALMAEYIQAQVQSGWLRNWTIAVIHNSEASRERVIPVSEKIGVGLTERNNSADPREPEYEISKSHIIDPEHEYIDLTDKQIEDAKAFTMRLAAKNKKAGIKRPNPLSIKQARPNENALLLIYFLDPFPRKSILALADCPIIGLAISFPEIDKDQKIQYAVNKQFLDQFDYPDEVEDTEEEEEWETESKEQKSTILADILAKMGNERNINANMAFRLRPGVAGTYFNASNSQLDPDEKDIIVEQSDTGHITDYSVVPFIRQRDLEQYRIKDSRISVINPSAVTAANTIIGAKKSDKFVFALTEDRAQADQNCTAIWTEGVPAGYILTVFNSSLFAFWSREEKAESVQDAVEYFPFKHNEHAGLLADVASAVSVLSRSGDKRDVRTLATYLINILDAAVFEIYFPEEFQQLEITILDYLQDVVTGSKDPEEIKKVFKKISQSGSPIHKALRAVYSSPKIRAIYDYLK